MSEPRVGDWLQIGGGSGDGWGTGRVEVRVVTGPNTWEWRPLSQEQKEKLLKLVNLVKHDPSGDLL
jgi:hypothetical protein